MAELLDKFQNRGSGRRGAVDGRSQELPDTAEEIWRLFKVVHPLQASISKESGEKERFWLGLLNCNTFLVCAGFEDPEDVTSISASVVNSLITSSLCTASDKNSWAYQLFKIYQQYPDSVMRTVMDQLRGDKMVSLKKQFNRKKINRRSYVPLSNSPYQLSVAFSHKFLSR